jgi:hypothetical protein
MKLFFINVFLFLFTIASVEGNGDSSSRSDDLLLMLSRMNDSSFPIPSDKRPVPSESVNITNWTAAIDLFNTDGSYKTALPVITEAEKYNASTKYDAHKDYLRELNKIARLYGYNRYYPGKVPDEHDGKEAYKLLVYNSLKWYFANFLPPGEVYHQTFNYHAYSATIVGLLENIGMLLYDDFHTDRQVDESIQQLFDEMVSYSHHMISSNPQTRGPNWAFRYGNCMRHVLFSNSPAEMDVFAAVNDASLDFDVWAVNGTDGIWPDWSLTHHGDMNYWGMYGVGWLSNTLELGRVVKGTSWEYSAERIQFIESSIIEGLQWILYNGNCEITTAPKRLTYYIERTDNVAAGVISNLQLLVELYGDKLANRAAIEQLIANIDPSWKVESGDANKQEIEGHRYFWNTEYQVHRRDHYSIAVRRTSQRVRGPEDSSNDDIKCHLHFGSGYTSILQRGDEYRLSRMGMDYQTLPGTTTELNGIVNAGKSASTKRGINLFSGATGDGMFGVGGFIMQLGQYTNGNWELVNGAGAMKGNFFFDQEMVCLGQDIKRIKAGASEIWTTLNQLQRQDDIVYAIDQGNETSVALNETVTAEISVNQEAWFWHDNVGYIIQAPEPLSMKLLAEWRALHPVLMQDSDYMNALSSEDRNTGTINMFQLAINHGTDPASERYHYTVVPGMTLNGFKQYMDVSPYGVIQNSDNIQAVYHHIDKALEVIFYEPGTLTVDASRTISVDKKAVVLLRENEGSLDISLANPVHRGLTPSFVSSASPTIGTLCTEPVSLTLSGFGVQGEQSGMLSIPISLPIDRAYEGKTSSIRLELKDGGGFGNDGPPILDNIKVNGVFLGDFKSSQTEYTVVLSNAEALVEGVAGPGIQVDVSKSVTEQGEYVLVASNANGEITYKVKVATMRSYTETFTNLVNTGSWINTSYVGDNDIVWEVQSVKYAIDQGTGAGVYTRSGHITSEPISGGISNFSVSLYNKWNSAGETIKVGVYINDVLVGTSENNSQDVVYNFSVENIDVVGDIIISVRNISDVTTTVVIDNISWDSMVPNRNAYLASLSVNGVPVSGFHREVFEYVFNYDDYSTGLINIDAVAEAISSAAFVIEPSSLPGSYFVKVVAEDGSYLEYELVFAASTQVNNKHERRVLVYPNPADSKVYMEGDFPEKCTWEIISLKGKPISNGNITQGRTTISLCGTLKGIYLIRVSSPNQVLYTDKLVVL